jgi:hypothetical protein
MNFTTLQQFPSNGDDTLDRLFAVVPRESDPPVISSWWSRHSHANGSQQTPCGKLVLLSPNGNLIISYRGETQGTGPRDKDAQPQKNRQPTNQGRAFVIRRVRHQDAERRRHQMQEQAMTRYLFCLFVATAAASSIAHAQDSRAGGHKGTAEQQRACRPDALRLCRGIHDDDAVLQCLRTNVARLHSVCRDVLESAAR